MSEIDDSLLLLEHLLWIEIELMYPLIINRNKSKRDNSAPSSKRSPTKDLNHVFSEISNQV